MSVVLVRNDGGLDHSACSESSEEQLHWGYILKVEQTGIADVFYVRLEGKRRKMTLEQLERQGCHIVKGGKCRRNRFGSKW